MAELELPKRLWICPSCQDIWWPGEEGIRIYGNDKICLKCERTMVEFGRVLSPEEAKEAFESPCPECKQIIGTKNGFPIGHKRLCSRGFK